MLVRYSLVCHPEHNPDNDLRKDLNGDWVYLPDLEAALKGIVQEIGTCFLEDPESVLNRAAVALQARHERIVALQAELAERNKEVERAIRLAENVS